MQIAFSFFVLGAENAIRRGELSHDQPASAEITDESPEDGVGYARHGGEDGSGGDGHSAEANGLGDGHVFSTGGDARAYIARIVPEFPHKPILLLRKRARESPRSMRGLKIRADPRRSEANLFLGSFRLGVLPAESLHAAGGIHKLLFAGKEWMAIRADFYVDVALVRRASGKAVAAGAHDADFVISGMNSWFHGYRRTSIRMFRF